MNPLKDSKYFRVVEMRCRDGTPYPEALEVRWAILSAELDTIREAFGGKLIIVSGYRTSEHNAGLSKVSREVARNSQHVQGRAADLRPLKRNLSVGDVNQLHQVVNELLAEGKLPAVGGVGVYPLIKDKKTNLLFPGFVHVDCRPRPEDGHIARWSGEDFGAELTGTA